MGSSDYAPTPTSVKKLSSPSRKRKTRISDFFNASLQTPKTTPSVNSALLSASTNYRQSRSTQKRILGYLTEASSASDTMAKMEKRRRIVPARLNYNEFDSSDSNYFAHNDIVWAN
uniref:Uncharacterized protein n=1 Tax=Ditylenchus dipsaci TaxID=166011 RepID=A0A915E2Q9_9BILA